MKSYACLQIQRVEQSPDEIIGRVFISASISVAVRREIKIFFILAGHG